MKQIFVLNIKGGVGKIFIANEIAIPEITEVFWFRIFTQKEPPCLALRVGKD